MKKRGALILLACAFALLTAERVAAGPVTWDFIATSCSEIPGANSRCDPTQRYPLVLATLTLTGPDSSGSASSNGLLPNAGDPFAFDLVAAQCAGCGNSHVSTADPTGPIISPPGVVPPDYWVVSYDISWTEVAGQLTAVDIGFFTVHDTLFRFGLTGGEVASDGTLAGCGASTCSSTGFGRW